MFSYTDILKKAYVITRNFPILWVFGFFVVGGFSLNFLHFGNIPVRQLQQPISWESAVLFFQTHPLTLAAISLSVLIISIGGLLLTNWCRIMLALLTRKIVEEKRTEIRQQLKASRQPLWPVIKVSLLTSVLVLLVTAALLGAPLWSHLDISTKTLLWSIASVVFVPVVFTISCINIFTTFFLVLHRLPLPTSLNLGTDFVIVNWGKILGLGLVLLIVFFAGSSVGGAVVFLSRVLIKFLLLYSLNFNFSVLSATILIIRSVAAAFLWLILAILNVFFNTSLLLLFFRLTTPVKEEEAVKSMAVSPATP